MRTLIARIFDYSADGIIAEEGTSFFDYCRELPDDPALVDRTREFYENADLHVMGRKFYQHASQYFPQAVDHPYADAVNAGRKVVFSRTLATADWHGTSIANGDLGAEAEKLKLDGDGYIVAHGGAGFWRSLIRHDLIDEYRLSVFPYLAGQGTRLFGELEQPVTLERVSAVPFGNGITELTLRRPVSDLRGPVAGRPVAARPARRICSRSGSPKPSRDTHSISDASPAAFRLVR